MAVAWVRASSARPATVLRSGVGADGLGQLLRGGAGGAGGLGGPGAGDVGGLGGPGAGLADGEVGLDLGLAGQRLGLAAELVEDGAGLLEGQVTGADDGEDRGAGCSARCGPGTASSPYCLTVWVVAHADSFVGSGGCGGAGCGCGAACSRPRCSRT